MATQMELDALKTIIGTGLPDDTLNAFIDTAGEILNGLNLGHSDDKMIEIKKYVSAHLVKLVKPDATSKKIADSQTTYKRSPSAMNLQSTELGQVACVLDTTGILTELGKGQVSFSAHGPDGTLQTGGRYDYYYGR